MPGLDCLPYKTSFKNFATYTSEDQLVQWAEDPFEKVDILNSQNETPLIIAARLGKVKVCEALLKRKDIQLNYMGLNGRTAFFHVASGENRDLFALFLNQMGLEVNKKGEKEATPLFAAISRKRLSNVKRLLRREDIDVLATYKERSIGQALEGMSLEPKEKSVYFKLFVRCLDRQDEIRNKKIQKIKSFVPKEITLLILDFEGSSLSTPYKQKYNLLGYTDSRAESALN